MTLHIYFLVYHSQVEYKRHEAWIIVSTLIGGKKINHSIVKEPVFFKINAEVGIKPTGLYNILAKSIPLSYFPYLLSLTYQK